MFITTTSCCWRCNSFIASIRLCGWRISGSSSEHVKVPRNSYAPMNLCRFSIEGPSLVNSLILRMSGFEQVGTRTLFPMSIDSCLIITHLQLIRNPRSNPMTPRENARANQTTLKNFLDTQFGRELEVRNPAQSGVSQSP
jgi:hypothetical protein